MHLFHQSDLNPSGRESTSDSQASSSEAQVTRPWLERYQEHYGHHPTSPQHLLAFVMLGEPDRSDGDGEIQNQSSDLEFGLVNGRSLTFHLSTVRMSHPGPTKCSLLDFTS